MVEKIVEKVLCPSPSPSANRVRVCHAVRFAHISLVSIILLYYRWFHSFSVLITEVTVQWWRMHVGQYVYISFVLLYCDCQATFHLSLWITALQFNFMSKILWHPFPIWSDTPTTIYCLRM